MAIEQLTTIEGMNAVAEEGKKTIQTLYNALSSVTGTGSEIDRIINRLQQYVDALEREEKELLDKFGIKANSIEDGQAILQNKFNNFYNRSGLSNFIGKQLEKTILDDYAVGINTKNAEISRFIKNVVVPEVAAVTAKVGEEEAREKAAQVLNDILNGMVITVTPSGSTTNFKKTVSSKKAVGEDGFISANKLTTAQKQRVMYILKHSNNPDIKNLVPTVDYSVHGNSIVTHINFNWYDITGGLKASDAKRLFKENSAELGKKNEQIIALILHHVDSKYTAVIYPYLRQMVNTNPYLFFVGDNTKDITGLLGEMSAIVAISELLDPKYKNKIVQWVAQHKVNNKQLSIDILLKDIAGIQVKNTSIDITRVPEINIQFAEGDSLLLRLEKYYGINFTDLEPVFESDAFNVPAIQKGKGGYQEVSIDFGFPHGTKGIPSDWEKLREAFNLMDTVINQAKDFLTMFSPDFLYMSGGTDFQNQLANLSGWLEGGINAAGITQANTLYIVAGRPNFASSMLKAIMDNIQKLQDIQQQAENTKRLFDISSSLGSYMEGKKSVPYNYVAYMNGKGGNISRKVKLTSSYLFSSK